MKKDRTRLLAWLLGGLYLTLAAAGAWTSCLYTLSGQYKDIIYALMDVTATNNDFGFFAPAVSSQVQVRTTFYDAQGQAEAYNFWSDNREINFRLNSIITTSMRQPLLRDVCTRSWAAALLGSRPTARQVTMVAYIHNVPTMEQFGLGKRLSWTPIYESTFERIDSPNSIQP